MISKENKTMNNEELCSVITSLRSLFFQNLHRKEILRSVITTFRISESHHGNEMHMDQKLLCVTSVMIKKHLPFDDKDRCILKAQNLWKKFVNIPYYLRCNLNNSLKM